MTKDDLRILENYVLMGNSLTTTQALELIESLKAAPQPEPKVETVSPLRLSMQEWMQDVGSENVMVLGGSNGDSMDAAFMGLSEVRGPDNALVTVAVYDYDRCIDLLVEDGMDLEEAEEYFEYNIANAYVGANTPIFFYRFPATE